MTCKIDFIGSVLYGVWRGKVEAETAEAAHALAKSNASEHAAMLGAMVQSPDTPLNTKRAIFFLVLNQDSAMRDRLQDVCPHKAALFYKTLHTNVVPDWLKDQTKTPDDFVETLRSVYRNS